MIAERIVYSTLESPVGKILIEADEGGIRGIYPASHRAKVQPQAHWRQDEAALADAREQLDAYFRGDLHDFSLPLNPQGTVFQCQVWKQLEAIPYGSTRSYGEIARALGKPTASRAVGAANGRNPISIVVPCHRVVGQDGSLTGYAGGLEMKQTLLGLERRYAPRTTE